MLFNSIEFPVFLSLVLMLFYSLRTSRQRQYLLLGASLFFYGYWKWTYLLLLIASSAIDFFAAIAIGKTQSTPRKRIFLWLSLLANVGILAYFKYSLLFGRAFFFQPGEAPAWIPVVLPVGISFYTFQAMSYVLDVYRGRMEAEKSWLDYLLFITFFPQLVAGPIERAPHLLGQLKNPKPALHLTPGILLLLSGFFKKLVIADRLAVYVDAVFNHPENVNPWQLMLGTFFFGFQIYGDFSGYSDIARGCASFFGIDLMTNFRNPYLARDLADFWRRWHISLSGWFRDYLYHPLGGSRKGRFTTMLNLLIVFAISGLWHGSNWTFLIWGCWHGLGLVFQKSVGLILKPAVFVTRSFTLIWVFAGWFFFRVNHLEDAALFSLKLNAIRLTDLSNLNLFNSSSEMSVALLSISVLMLMESGIFRVSAEKLQGAAMLKKLAFGALAASILIWFGHFKGGDFIYFQF
jgi:alginate O-acetyltransferase complex protein AlgI